MEQFQSYFGLKLSYLVFVAVEQLAVTLQSKDISAEICRQAVKMATQFLERQRSVQNFDVFWEGVVADSEGLTMLPRKEGHCGTLNPIMNPFLQTLQKTTSGINIMRHLIFL